MAYPPGFNVSEMLIVSEPSWVTPCTVNVNDHLSSNSFVAELSGYEPNRFRVSISALSPMYLAWRRGELTKSNRSDWIKQNSDLKHQEVLIRLRPAAATRRRQELIEKQIHEEELEKAAVERQKRLEEEKQRRVEKEKNDAFLMRYYIDDASVRNDLENPREWIRVGIPKSSVDSRLGSAFIKTSDILETSDGLAVKYYYTVKPHSYLEGVLVFINSRPPFSGLTIYYRRVENQWRVIEWAK